MDIFTHYIPREYLAMKINYLRSILSDAPIIKVVERKRGDKMVLRCVVNGHNYSSTSKRGRVLFQKSANINKLRKELDLLTALWNSSFVQDIPDDIRPVNSERFLNPGNPSLRIKMDWEFFKSLKNDSNSAHPETKKYPYNGIYYRSRAEARIAKFYTEHNIPFKYEPEIYLDGYSRPVYPDFVIFIKELNCCKIHEHLGLLQFDKYKKDVQFKFTAFTNAGLIPEYDLFYTSDSSDLMFDEKNLLPLLNTVIINSLISSMPDNVHIEIPYSFDGADEEDFI
ncbi:MAG: hypothetical protein K6F79_10035 [Saccharofermentans sp.]|nr:hypothetical protein [Saccharofermentans sp.]